MLALQVPSLETTGEKWRLSGSATDDNHIEDVFVIVSNRDNKIEGKKVYYLSSRGKKAQNKLDFATDIPVWPGNNMVTVIARENNEVRAAQTIFIYRTDGVKSAAR
jgi:carboxyl-terminal processing protease